MDAARTLGISEEKYDQAMDRVSRTLNRTPLMRVSSDLIASLLI